MINRLNHNNAAAAALQRAAELRSTQSASSSTATQKTGAKYNFAEIFGGASNCGELEKAAKASSTTASSHSGFSTAIATATAAVVDKAVRTPGETAPATRAPAIPAATAQATATTAAAPTPTAAAATTPTTPPAAPTTATAAPTATTASTATTTATTTPGVEALVTAIMNGSFKPTYVTSASQLTETYPGGTDTMPNFYYASDQTAAQLAQLLGGTVVKQTPFGQDEGWSVPDANFIELPSGQTFNAASVAYYANTGSEGAAQLTADITSTINQGSAWATYYQQGGQMPSFSAGYVGPPIAGMTYPSGSIGSDGNVINPAMQTSGTLGT